MLAMRLLQRLADFETVKAQYLLTLTKFKVNLIQTILALLQLFVELVFLLQYSSIGVFLRFFTITIKGHKIS